MFRKAHKLIKYLKLLVTRKIHLNNNVYSLHTIALNQLTIQASNPEYEPEIFALFADELDKNGGYFIDVGANYGQTLLSVLAVDQDIPYLGIEPQADCVSNILDFIQINKLNNHRIICACVSVSDNIAHLELGYVGDVRASIISDFRPSGTFEHKIPTVAVVGDKLIKDLCIEKVQFIKIDVEGAELEVLESFRRTINHCKPAIVFEVLPDKLVSTGAKLPDDVIVRRRDREAALADFFESVDYEYALLAVKQELKVVIGPDPYGKVRNYVARPKAY